MEDQGGLAACGLTGASARDSRGRELRVKETMRNYCYKKEEHSPPSYAFSAAIEGFAVRGKRVPDVAVMSTESAPLARASERAVQVTERERGAIASLFDGRKWSVVQVVEGSFDGDRAVDRALVVEYSDPTLPREERVVDRQLVFVPAAGAAWIEEDEWVRKILAVSDVDRDGIEEILIWSQEPCCTKVTRFMLVVPRGTRAIAAHCDAVPSYIEDR